MKIHGCWESTNQHLRGRSGCSNYCCSLCCLFHLHSQFLLVIRIHRQGLHRWTSFLGIKFYFSALFQSIGLNLELLFHILQHKCKRLIYKDKNLPYWKCFPCSNLHLNLSHLHLQYYYLVRAHLTRSFQFCYLIFRSLCHRVHLYHHTHLLRHLNHYFIAL
jgi:hypothetical protein